MINVSVKTLKKFFVRKPTIPKINPGRKKPEKIGDERRLVWTLSATKASMSFCVILFVYIVIEMIMWVLNWKIWPRGWSKRWTDKLIALLVYFAKKLPGGRGGETLNRIDLIEMSLRNMKVKKTRTMVTIGGMAISIGSIVFLVSLGYGLQRLVVNRVARLEELRQVDVFSQTGSNVRINDKLVYSLKEIDGVKLVLPLIAVVGRVNYQNSVVDLAVYGVSSDYLNESAIKPIEGQVYNDKEQNLSKATNDPRVAGAMTENPAAAHNSYIGEVDFSIKPGQWLKVREQPTRQAGVVGYTRRVEGGQVGKESWGGSYIDDTGRGEAGFDENNQKLGRWIKTKVYLWEKIACTEENGGCEEGTYLPMRDENNDLIQKEGWLAEVNMIINESVLNQPAVLGLKTETETAETTTETKNNLDGIDWVEIASESGVSQVEEVNKIDVPESSIHQIVINQAMQKVLGLTDGGVIDKTIDVSFIVVSDLLEDNAKKIESNPTSYKITGVVLEGNSPMAYVPFEDIKGLGVVNYSQAKVVTGNTDLLARIRTQIGAMGFTTQSVVDTVAQIDNLFNTARAVLALLGMVALAVAALGMFNTLTVSLMERTREVGLMKALGMKSSEVRELFLAESMVMGLLGGLFGIAFGFVSGKLVGVLLTTYALIKGVGVIDVSYIPPLFIGVIIFLSLLVGLFTGLYPARRATKISALNALRYE